MEDPFNHHPSYACFEYDWSNLSRILICFNFASEFSGTMWPTQIWSIREFPLIWLYVQRAVHTSFETFEQMIELTLEWMLCMQQLNTIRDHVLSSTLHIDFDHPIKIYSKLFDNGRGTKRLNENTQGPLVDFGALAQIFNWAPVLHTCWIVQDVKNIKIQMKFYQRSIFFALTGENYSRKSNDPIFYLSNDVEPQKSFAKLAPISAQRMANRNYYKEFVWMAASWQALWPAIWGVHIFSWKIWIKSSKWQMKGRTVQMED